MKHPGDVQLALFAGKDLGLLSRLLVAWHLRKCGDCRAEVEALQFARARVRDLADELPAGVHWKQLSQEMTANIHVGLAAGECVGPVSERPRLRVWKPALAFAVATVVVAGVLWLKLPQEQRDHLVTALQSIRFDRSQRNVAVPAVPDGVILEASQESIALRERGASMSFLNAGGGSNSRPASVSVSVSMQGSAGARYVDPDTGQVTINKVYYAQ